MRLVSALFSFGGEISRRGYISVACVGVLAKQLVDLLLADAFHRPWDFTHYLMPVGVPVVLGHLTLDDMRFLTVMLAASVPFAWVGLAITAKRFRTIGWPLWLIVLFFVPIANIAS